MKNWQSRTTRYFYLLAGAILLTVLIFILVDSIKSRQVKNSLLSYMNSLRDMVFMSTYDSLKKGNMKLFKNHMEEVGTFDDVREFSLLNREGVVHYSSAPARVKQVDPTVINLATQKIVTNEGLTTFYFPVETISYCYRCHPDWQVGSINSYYKLTLSHAALDTVRQTTMYFHGFTVLGGGVFLAFFYLLFSLYERRKHEEQLHLSASVFDNAAEAMVISTVDGIVQRINTAFTRITGFAEQDIVGRDVHLLDAGEINTETYRQMRTQLGQEGLWSGELWNLKKTGESIPVRLSITAIRNIQQRITHFISIFYDISTEKAAERALLEMDKIKSEFISTAAHELRTPLSAIMGFTEIVREPEKFGEFTQDQISDFLDEVYDRGEALSQLIDDLLDISRIESGSSIQLHVEEVCLTDVLAKAVDFCKVLDPSHRFHFELPEKSADSICLIDRHRINQVLENLLSNASKYSPAGTDIFLRCYQQPQSWEVSVEDRGIGMTPEQVGRIFDKFYRADSSNTAISGLGLGMSIAKQIVELHGGGIRVESAIGVGTSVTFSIPLEHFTNRRDEDAACNNSSGPTAT